MNTSQNVSQRLASELRLKLLLTLLLNLWFYLPYSFLQRFPLFAPTQIPSTPIDLWLPFSDRAVWVYLSLFLLMPIGPLLMCRRAQLIRYGWGIFLIATVSYLVFIVWPTWCPRPNPADTIIAYRLLTALDTPLHAFPSLHAAFAVFSALCATLVLGELRVRFWWRIGVAAWTLLILLATLLTKQHRLADILGGSALGFSVYCSLFSNWIHNLKMKLSPQTVRGNEMRPTSTIL